MSGRPLEGESIVLPRAMKLTEKMASELEL